LIGFITTAEDAVKAQDMIKMNDNAQKANGVAEGDRKKLPLSGINIAFTRKGLLKVSQLIQFAISCFNGLSG
jgi:hypothetical protein